MEGPNNGPTANTQAQEFLESIHTAASDVMQMQVDYRLQESKVGNDKGFDSASELAISRAYITTMLIGNVV